MFLDIADSDVDTKVCTISSVLAKLAQIDTEERAVDADIERLTDDLKKFREREQKLKCRRVELEKQLSIQKLQERLQQRPEHFW